MSSTEHSNSRNLTIAMIISMIFWGISWPSSGILTHYANPITLGIYRYLLVIISLWIILLALKIPIKISRAAVPSLLIAGILMAFYNFTFLKGLQLGSPGAGGILVTTLNPIMAYALGMLIDWRKPTKNESIGLLLGILAGCFLLKVWENSASIFEAGNIFFLLSALLWSIMSKFTSKSANFGSPFAYTWWLYIITCSALIPFIDVTEVSGLISNTEMKFWGNLLFSSVIVTSLATTMYFYATSKIGAEKASSFIFTVPFTAAISSALIVGEIIQWHTAIGGLIGIGAVFMINKKVKQFAT